MKKYIFIILISIIMILTLLGVLTKYYLEQKDTKDIHSTANNIALSLNSSQIGIDDPTLEVVIENSNNFEVKYGTDWTIERYVNEEWKKVYPIGVGISSSRLIGVKPHDSNTETVDLGSYLKDDLITGKYRIIKETIQPTHQLGVTFEIK